MVLGVHRNASITVNVDAIYDNINAEVHRLKPGCQLFMVVKANGYGHGAVQVAKVAKKAGATGFCVAILDEALELRAAGFDEPILVLGVSRIQDVALIAQNHISVTVPSVEWLQAAVEQWQLANQRTPLPRLLVHLGLDTGMGRIGLQSDDEVRKVVALLNQYPNVIEFEGIFTHFSCADDPDDAYFKLQVSRFNHLVNLLPKKPRYVHVSNSATSLWHDQCNGNMVRFGVAGYGLNPSGRAIPQTPYPLHPAMTITSEVVFCKQIQAGRSVGYGATYTADTDQFIATVPVGYADGIPRRLQNFHVLIDGQFCPIVGRVCMDQLMVRVPQMTAVGTKVTFVGIDGAQSITLQDVADYCGTIHYELACQLTARLPRHYVGTLD